MSNSALSSALTLIKGDLQVDLLPVIIGALQVLQKSPGGQGVLAAEAYLLGNAPAALIATEAQLLQQGIADLEARLQAVTNPPAATPAKA